MAFDSSINITANAHEPSTVNQVPLTSLKSILQGSKNPYTDPFTFVSPTVSTTLKVGAPCSYEEESFGYSFTPTLPAGWTTFTSKSTTNI